MRQNLWACPTGFYHNKFALHGGKKMETFPSNDISFHFIPKKKKDICFQVINPSDGLISLLFFKTGPLIFIVIQPRPDHYFVGASFNKTRCIKFKLLQNKVHLSVCPCWSSSAPNSNQSWLYCHIGFFLIQKIKANKIYKTRRFEII